MNQLLDTVQPKNEPLVWLGASAALVAAVVQQSANGSIDWRTALPIVVAFVLRNFVTPNSKADQLVEGAKQDVIVLLDAIDKAKAASSVPVPVPYPPPPPAPAAPTG